MDPVAVHFPVAGSYSSVLSRASISFSPPSASTLPFFSSTAAWYLRTVVMLPVAVQVPVGGSYSSHLSCVKPLGPLPPQAITLPLERVVKVWL